ncbi:MAG: metalloregulator ArsR/SmtB family transcription factor [Pseudomonadota bacterium]
MSNEHAHIIDDEVRIEELAAVLKGLGHPIRLRLVMLLCHEDLTVTQLVERLGVRQSLVSQHLSMLRMLSLVQADRTGGTATYSLREEGLRNMMQCVGACRSRGD